ncbi:hypothetical protein FH715_17265 [Streptomyces sedi]|uniref:Uncharacterized protein n=1 Tax=Streptomyces sedi TaxID=555059 RepID=A0A5C4UYH3_9ACTN|nr:hypothetical protein FH715_17265 [Streptomyces sedi]
MRAFWARCGLRTSTADRQEALVSHRNAPLTPTGRLRLARTRRRAVPRRVHPAAPRLHRPAA